MNNPILEKLHQPQALEVLYQQSPDAFKTHLNQALSAQPDSETLQVWQARLRYQPHRLPHSMKTLGLLIGLCLMVGIGAKLPTWFTGIDGTWYVDHVVPMLLTGGLSAYFLRIANAKLQLIAVVVGVFAVGLLYTVWLPANHHSDAIFMATLHLPLLYFSLLALSFMGNQWQDTQKRLHFIGYVGEMLLYSALILLGGIVLSVVTLSLFAFTEIDIYEWYYEYIVVVGLVSSPLVATYLFDQIQQRQTKFAPMLANVFAPLFLLAVLAYLMASLFQGINPYQDRDFLITFNALLFIILSLTMYSLAGKPPHKGTHLSDIINVCLILTTLIVNTIALSAILFRWVEYGLTVNRLVMTGANGLIFIHLLLILNSYYRYLQQRLTMDQLQHSIARYLPFYTLWGTSQNPKSSLSYSRTHIPMRLKPLYLATC